MRALVSLMLPSHLHTPQLTLVAEAVLANELQLSVETLLLERTTGFLESLAICVGMGWTWIQ